MVIVTNFYLNSFTCEEIQRIDLMHSFNVDFSQEVIIRFTDKF